MARPQYEATGGIYGDGGANAVLDYPSTVNADDILIAVVGDAASDYFENSDDEWHRVVADESGNLSSQLWWKRADGTETGSATFTGDSTAGQLVFGIMYRFSGCVKYGVPFEKLTFWEANTQSTHTVSFADAPLGSERLACAFNLVEDNTINGFSGTGWTEESRLSTSTGSDAHTACATLDAGATAPVSAVWTTSANEYALKVGLYLIPDPLAPVTLNTPTDTADITDTTPKLEFTGNSVSNLDVEYQIEIDTVNTFDSQFADMPIEFANILYDQRGGSDDLSSDTFSAGATTFVGNGKKLHSVNIGMFVPDGTTGTVVCELFASDGGSPPLPTGSALATSNTINLSDITGTENTDPSFHDFIFPTGERYTLVDGTTYFISIRHSDSTDKVEIMTVDYGLAFDSAAWNGTVWGTVPDSHLSYKMFTDEGMGIIKKESETPDATFTNTTDGADTHPFDDNEKCDYEVQVADVLSIDTYYWRVRAKNPTGNDVYGEWSATRSFDVVAGATGKFFMIS